MERHRPEDKDNVERQRLEDKGIAGNKIKTYHKETKLSFAKMDRKLTVEEEEEGEEGDEEGEEGGEEEEEEEERTGDCKVMN